MENTVLIFLKNIYSVVRYLFINIPLTAIVSLLVFKLGNRNSIIKEAPSVFVVDIDEFDDLEDGFKQDKYSILHFSKRKNESSDKEVTIPEFENMNLQDVGDCKNMVYIHIENNFMDGLEFKILDSHKMLLEIQRSPYKFIARGSKIGFFVDSYNRPIKIYMECQKKIFEYDIYNDRGSIRAKIKKTIKILK